MANMSHAYVTAHGAYNSGQWAGETAQFGLRLTMDPVASRPARGTFYTPGECGVPAVSTGTQAGTHGTLTKGFTCRVGGTGSTENLDAAAQIDLAEDVWIFLDALKQYCPTTFRWTHIKVGAVDTLGKIPVASSVYTLTTPLAGSGTPQNLPPQVSVACSLRAPVLGRRGRGRVYLPFTVVTLGTDATIGSGLNSAIRTAMATLIGNMENTAGWTLIAPDVAIMSATSTTAIRPTEVRVGSRFDTVRSRRQQIAETYTATAL